MSAESYYIIRDRILNQFLYKKDFNGVPCWSATEAYLFCSEETAKKILKEISSEYRIDGELIRITLEVTPEYTVTCSGEETKIWYTE